MDLSRYEAALADHGIEADLYDFDLHDADTAEEIRRATPEEAAQSLLSEARGSGGAILVEIDGEERTCYCMER